MHQEQRRLVSNSGLALDLQRAYTFLAGASFPEGIGPMPHRNRAVLIDAVHAHSELLVAGTAAPQESLIALASLAVPHLVNLAAFAVSAARVFAPTLFLEEFHGGGFIHASAWKFRDDSRLIRSNRPLSFCHTR